ncbi:MAG: ATP-binding protein [Chloroflexaceae bacterium]|nr:ATP-binding protein [Chloroflexaceae bacterium]
MSDEPATQSGHDIALSGGNLTRPGGDYVGGDETTTGDVSGRAIAIGRGAQAIYQEILRPLPVNLSALVRPLIEHYAADVFGGRDAELAALDAFLADPRYPFGLLVAPTGIGKTALLVHWIARVQQQQPQWRIIFAPVSIRYQTAGEQTALSLLAQGLADLHRDLEQFRAYDQAPTSLRALIADYLRRELPDGAQALVVLDGIDEATGWTVGPLCAAPPQTGLKIVVAARQRANATREDWRRHLGWEAAAVQELDLRALDLPAIAALLRQSGPALAARAADPNFVAQFYRVSEGDPLTANLLIKALTGGQIAPESLTRRPPGLEAFLKDWVETLRRRRQASRAIRELLALCAAAYGPLTSDDLQALAPEVFVEQSDIVDAVHDDEVARFIITVGEHSYVFSHQRLREVFLEQICPPKDRERLQQRLIAYGNAWYADRSRPLPDYLRQFWIAHLKSAEEWERMRQVLTEIVPSADGQRYLQPWQAARHAAEGSDSGYLSDLDVLWRHAEEQGDLGLMLRCALIAASLRSRAGNLFPELLVQLVKVGTPEGKWSPAAALETIAQMPDADKQVACLAALLADGIALPWERALEVARAIDDEQYRTEALGALAPHLPPALLGEALTAARAIQDEGRRAGALAALAPHLPEALLGEALAAARAIFNEEWRAAALAALAPRLPPADQVQVLGEALAAARAIQDEGWRAGALGALAPHLPEPLLGEVLAAARAIQDEWSRAWALSALAPRLSPADQVLVLGEALAAARALKDEERRARTLGALAPRLPPADRVQVLGEALAAARAIQDEGRRAGALADLAPRLPATLLGEVLAAARAIEDEGRRARALSTLAPRLPPADRVQVLGEALAAARAIFNEEWRADALAALAPRLPVTLLGEALAAARAIRDEDNRATALGALAPRLPPADQVQVLGEALAAARAAEGEDNRAAALGALAPHLAEACSEATDRFAEMLRCLARRGRPALLDDLTALAPWIVALAERHGQPAVAALARAIVETGRCWE